MIASCVCQPRLPLRRQTSLGAVSHLAGLAYDLIGRQSPFWLGITLMAGVISLVAGGLPPRQAQAPVDHTMGPA